MRVYEREEASYAFRFAWSCTVSVWCGNETDEDEPTEFRHLCMYVLGLRV